MLSKNIVSLLRQVVFVGIYCSIGSISILEGLPTSWENRGLERLAVWKVGCALVCA